MAATQAAFSAKDVREFILRCKRAKKALQETRKQVASLQRRRATLAEEFVAVDGEVERLAASEERLKESLIEAKLEHDATKLEHRNLSDGLSEARGQIRALKKQVLQADSEYAEAVVTCGRECVRHEEVEKETERLARSLTTVNAERLAFKEKAEGLEAAIRKREARLQELRAKTQAFRAAITSSIA